ncbi:MAG: ATP-binding protein, partial [Campylobacterota bacterium]|nr:ATP-binding protein [Campylobacterota bacterium]
MSNIDGLKKIYLIKSADYQFAEINLSDNTLLLGESGVGKTTLMRAILFFYTMDYSDTLLNINPETKKSFNQWYFQEPNSHIIYEYTKDDSRSLFIVSNGGHLHYTFIDMTDSELTVKELFLDKNRPRNLQELHENIQLNNLPNYATSKKENYINTFHKKDSNNKKIKQESQTNFTLFEDINSRKEFAKTVSNIFTSSKVHSDTLKKTIVSLIQDSNATINLKKIKDDLNDYVINKREIEDFELKFPTIEKLATTLTDYETVKLEFQKRANQIYKLKTHTVIKSEEIAQQLELLKSESKKLEQHFSISKEIIDEKIALKRQEITIESNDIKNLQIKEKEYKENDIERLLNEYNSEEKYKNEKQNLSIKYKALTSNVENINAEYNKILQKLEKEKEYALFNIKTLKNSDEKKINDKKIAIIQDQESRFLEATTALNSDKIALEEQLKISLESFNEIKIQQGKIENYLFNRVNIDIYS